MNRLPILLVVAAGAIWLWPVPPERAAPEPLPPPTPQLLSVDAPGDQAVRAFMQNFAARMAVESPKFAQRVEQGEFANQAGRAAQVYHDLSEDARHAAQSAILQRVDRDQDDRTKIVAYIRESAIGWSRIAQTLGGQP